MWATNEEKTFYHELITSLPLNRFIEKMIINAAHFDVAGLLENIARQNKAVKEVICLGENLYRNENDIQMLQRELQQNHILESIQISKREPFQAISRLNKAGRRYLSEESTSNSKYIVVLAKVKNDLDCLYYHLRENPILCMSYCNGGGRQTVGGTNAKLAR